MNTVYEALGWICLGFGGVFLVWGAVGRYLDKHSYSEDDGAAMLYGAIIAVWGVFLVAVSW